MEGPSKRGRGRGGTARGRGGARLSPSPSQQSVSTSSTIPAAEAQPSARPAMTPPGMPGGGGLSGPSFTNGSTALSSPCPPLILWHFRRHFKPFATPQAPRNVESGGPLQGTTDSHPGIFHHLPKPSRRKIIRSPRPWNEHSTHATRHRSSRQSVSVNLFNECD